MPDHIVSEEWLRARPDAVTLPPEGRIHQPTITDEMYPIQIAWDGILVDDPEHNRDIIQNIRNLLLLLWPDDKGAHVELIEQEMCEILGSRDLREYFRRPPGFFEDHLKKYSKSKRQAPIYWPLSTISGSYTLWIYCHRLTSDTLYIAVNRYVAQKISIVQRYLAELASQITDATGREALRRTSPRRCSHRIVLPARPGTRQRNVSA